MVAKYSVSTCGRKALMSFIKELVINNVAISETTTTTLTKTITVSNYSQEEYGPEHFDGNGHFRYETGEWRQQPITLLLETNI